LVPVSTSLIRIDRMAIPVAGSLATKKRAEMAYNRPPVLVMSMSALANSGHLGTREIYFGGLYGSGVPGAIGGYFFRLCSKSVTIFMAGPTFQLLRSAVAGYSS
jgi:hypothetical protein